MIGVSSAGAATRALSMIQAQRDKGIPEDEILVDTAMVWEFVHATPSVLHLMPTVKGDMRLFGARVGRPCPYCARRKPNKGKSCDGCGAPR